MNLLKTLWNKLVSKTSVSPTLVVAEEEDERSAGEIFYMICRQAKVGHAELTKNRIVEDFEEWYDGPRNEECIRKSIKYFRDENSGVISAKLAGVPTE
tara:strand:+ start:123 stop:416 length:294 start_codon:yes stop_codon:yes gene_type:complete